MKRLKIFGVAAVASLVLAATLGAFSASASEFRNPEGGTTTWSGSPTGENHRLILGGSEQFSCTNTSFSGTMTGVSAAQVTVAPQLGGCSWQQGLSFSWALNGCKYRLRPGLGEPNSTLGWVDIVGCEKPMSVNYLGCELKIGNQNGLGTVQYKNQSGEKEYVRVIAQLSGIEFTRSGGCSGPPGTFTSGTYTGEWNVKGLNAKSQPVHISVLGTSTPQSFAVDQAPASVTGKSAKEIGFFVFGGNGVLRCSEHSLSGELTSTTSASIAIVPAYQGCDFLGQSPKLSMGGCSYVFHASGGFDIVGATCATNPISVSALGCTMTVGPQSGLTGVTYANEGSAKLRSVKTGGEAGGLKYTAKGCPKNGSFSDGVYRSVDKFTATISGGSTQGFWVE